MLSDNEVKALCATDILSMDIESKDPKLLSHGPGCHREDGYITGVGIGCEVAANKIAAYAPLCHPDMENDTDMIERNKKILDAVLSAPSQKLGANIAYDLEWLETEGYNVNMDCIHDIQYAEPILDEYARSYSLDKLARKYTKDVKKTDVLKEYADSMGWKGKPVSHIWRMPSSVAGEYCISDITLPIDIFKKQKAQLEAENLWDLYTMETKLIPVLLLMRRNGVRLDVPLLHKTALGFTEKRYQLSLELADWLGGNINLGSPKQLAERFDYLGIDYPRREPTKLMKQKGKKGNPRLDKDALTKIARQHPNCKTLLEYRHCETMESMFFLPYLDFMVGDRLHGTFHPLRSDDYGTVSGRFSASKPNLQQVSAIDEDTPMDELDDLKGKILRQLFIPEEGRRWAKLDYSQIEYRIMVHYATGNVAEELRRRYNSDPTTDMHQVICDNTGFDRRTAKRLNFGGLFGMGAQTASEMFGWGLQEAKDYMAGYHNSAPYIKTLRNDVSSAAARRGYIYTLLGRKARTHHSRKLHSMTNRLMQGSAADVMKKSMVDAYASGVFEELTLHLTVHDEMDVSYKDDSAGNEALDTLKDIMENTVKISVPLTVDCHTGINWAEAD